MSASLRSALPRHADRTRHIRRTHRKSSDALAELLHLWEVVNVVDEKLGPGEGSLRRPGVVDGKEAWPGLMTPGEALLVELPGIETGAEIALTCKNTALDDAKVRETTRDDLRNTRKALMASTLAANLSQGATTVAPGPRPCLPKSIEASRLRRSSRNRIGNGRPRCSEGRQGSLKS